MEDRLLIPLEMIVSSVSEASLDMHKVLTLSFSI